MLSPNNRKNDFPKIQHRSRMNKCIISDTDDDEDDSKTSSMSSDNSTSKSNERKETKQEVSLPNKKWTGPDIKLNLKPLGFDKNLDKWIESTKSNPLIASSTISNSKDKLESGKTMLKDMQIEILEKFYSAMDSIPVPVLSQFPQFNEESYQKLKILNQRIKAKLRQTERRLLALNDEKETNVSYCNLDSPSIVSSSYSNKSTCISEKSLCSKVNSKEEIAINDYSNISQEKCANNEKLQSRLSSANDHPIVKETINSNEPTTPNPSKRKSQFQLKVPVKATLSPEVSKKLEEMMDKNNRGKVCSTDSQTKVALNFSITDSTSIESNSFENDNYSESATTFEKSNANTTCTNIKKKNENSTVNSECLRTEDSWKNKFGNNFGKLNAMIK